MKYGTTHIIYYQGKNKLHEIWTFEQKFTSQMSTSIKKNILTLQVQNLSYVDRELDLFNRWVTEKINRSNKTQEQCRKYSNSVAKSLKVRYI
jgi:hypothetical protein